MFPWFKKCAYLSEYLLFNNFYKFGKPFQQQRCFLIMNEVVNEVEYGLYCGHTQNVNAFYLVDHAIIK